MHNTPEEPTQKQEKPSLQTESKPLSEEDIIEKDIIDAVEEGSASEDKLPPPPPETREHKTPHL
jgi:hypothetical protein